MRTIDASSQPLSPERSRHARCSAGGATPQRSSGKNWIVGRRTLVGIGVGATRLFGGPLAGDSLTLPTFRIANVGVTF